MPIPMYFAIIRLKIIEFGIISDFTITFINES